ncbi:MAG: AbrB/MazE/SpoVT family DNA-binding domain-containing protein [Dehalococcoidia bacterium]
MASARITSKGQVTIPKRVREALGLRAGDKLIFLVEKGGAYVHPVHRRTADELYGSLSSDVPYPGDDAEQRAIGGYVGAEYQRELEAELREDADAPTAS